MDEDRRTAFISQLWQRFEELQKWAIANWPDQGHPLSSSDFLATRLEILNLGRTPVGKEDQAPNAQAPEPEHGGPQYEEVTPAPWP